MWDKSSGKSVNISNILSRSKAQVACKQLFTHLTSNFYMFYKYLTKSVIFPDALKLISRLFCLKNKRKKVLLSPNELWFWHHSNFFLPFFWSFWKINMYGQTMADLFFFSNGVSIVERKFQTVNNSIFSIMKVL